MSTAAAVHPLPVVIKKRFVPFVTPASPSKQRVKSPERAAWCQIPHPKPHAPDGEDSVIVVTDGSFVAVCDGVGGWASETIRPREFADAVAAGMYDAHHENRTIPMRELIRKGHLNTRELGVEGGTTVTVACVDGNHVRFGSLGDSGVCAVSRADGTFLRMTPMQHVDGHFNRPYQLSSSQLGQTAADACSGSVDLVPGDVLILGSDGLFDNLFDSHMVNVVKALPDNATPAEYAQALALAAYRTSHNATAHTPYSVGSGRRGGKPDDITVAVVLAAPTTTM